MGGFAPRVDRLLTRVYARVVGADLADHFGTSHVGVRGLYVAL